MYSRSKEGIEKPELPFCDTLLPKVVWPVERKRRKKDGATFDVVADALAAGDCRLPVQTTGFLQILGFMGGVENKNALYFFFSLLPTYFYITIKLMAEKTLL